MKIQADAQQISITTQEPKQQPIAVNLATQKTTPQTLQIATNGITPKELSTIPVKQAIHSLEVIAKKTAPIL